MRRSEFVPNLEFIGRLIQREAPHVAALQEVDFACSTGFFEHLPVIRYAAGMGHTATGEHANIRFAGASLVYGTAVMSGSELFNLESDKFATERNDFQGYTVASVAFPGRNELVDVWSVHLSPGGGSGSRQRRAQMDLMVDVIRARARPFVVAGDMNCGWTEDEPGVQHLAWQLNLSAPEEYFPTYPSNSPDEYFDWILVSDELEITSYEVLKDRVSDHLPVVANIQWKRSES